MLPPTSEKHHAPIRGEITGFSKPSRRRLLELFARMDVKRSTRAKFLTLTFTEIVTAMEAKKALRRFTMRMSREYPEWSCVWRFERQRRGAPHFHLLMFNVPFIPQKDLQKTWEECTKEPMSIVHIKSVHNRKHAMQYISKYIGKVSEDNFDVPCEAPSLENPSYLHADEKQGRVWGYVNKALLPFAPLEEVYIQDDELAHYIRWYASATTRGKAGRTEYRTLIYTDEAYEMFKWAERHARESGEAVREKLSQQIKWAARMHAGLIAAWVDKQYGPMQTISGMSVDIEKWEVKPFTRRARMRGLTCRLMTTQLHTVCMVLK